MVQKQGNREKPVPSDTRCELKTTRGSTLVTITASSVSSNSPIWGTMFNGHKDLTRGRCVRVCACVYVRVIL